MPPFVEGESTFQPKIFSDAEYDRLEQSLPEAFVDTLTCGITNKIMKKPVVAADGYTYEKDAILKWLMQSSLSPCTEQVMSSCTLRPNRALANQIECMMTKGTDQDAVQDADQDADTAQDTEATTKLSLTERLLLAKKESEELHAAIQANKKATASLSKQDMERAELPVVDIEDKAKKEKKPRGAPAPEATSKRKGKAKATAKASQVVFRAKKPRGPPVQYAGADDDSDSSSS